MADLAKTSRLNVTFDFLMVLLVLYCAPIAESWQTFEWRDSIIHYDTIFVGLGVLSFAFVCQHSSFIIAGSLDRPTNSRWATVTKIALTASVTLALACGVGGFIGFREDTEGNILNSLDESLPAKVARGLLGTTMLFVYPMESFVARHVCVVMFFKGRSAHEGDDTSVLNRRDRRITLTMVLYLISVIPAALFENLGSVLASTGAVGGSCLSYIGPGAIYLGIHGARFLELARAYFGKPGLIAPLSEETTPLYGEPAAKAPPLMSTDSWPVRLLKTILWYALSMPIWCWIATVGKTSLTNHVTDLAMKSPHPIRIGNVRFAAAKLIGGETRVVMLQNRVPSGDDSSKFPTDTMLLRSDSLPGDYGTARTTEGRIVALPAKSTLAKGALPTTAPPQKGYQSMTNKAIGENLMAKRRKEQEELDLEDDPQEAPPGVVDFMVAIFYIIFGVVAMFAGLFSIFIEKKG
jgi:sodium-coupled neutral amino acid transporter 11